MGGAMNLGLFSELLLSRKSQFESLILLFGCLSNQVCSVLGLVLMFEFGVLLFGCLGQVCNVLGLILVFGFKVLRDGCRCKGLVRLLLAFKESPFDHPGTVNRCESDADSSKVSKKPTESEGIASSNVEGQPSGVSGAEQAGEENVGSAEQDQFCAEGDGLGEMESLRRMVEMEKQRADAAWSELEKERAAAATAAEEAMAMVMRLQSEKSAVCMEAHQFRRLAEQKLRYDEEVILSLRLRVAELESGRRSSSAADQDGFWSEILSQYEEPDMWGVGDGIHPTRGHIIDDGLEA